MTQAANPVDLICSELLGAWLVDKDRTLLHDLARNGKTIWEQRIGIPATMRRYACEKLSVETLESLRKENGL